MLAATPLSARAPRPAPAPRPTASPRPTRVSTAPGRRARGGVGGGVATATRFVCRAGKIEQIDAEQLETALATRDRPLVIDFFATWCGPCLLLAKELETVAADLGDAVRIVKIDVDANDELAGALQIQGLPTLVFVGMDPAKPALRTEGLLPAASIKQIIEEELD